MKEEEEKKRAFEQQLQQLKQKSANAETLPKRSSILSDSEKSDWVHLVSMMHLENDSSFERVDLDSVPEGAESLRHIMLMALHIAKRISETQFRMIQLSGFSRSFKLSLDDITPEEFHKLLNRNYDNNAKSSDFIHPAVSAMAYAFMKSTSKQFDDLSGSI